MLSKYFETKTKEREFDNELHNLIAELKGKKIIIYGAGEGFKTLNRKYNFNEELDMLMCI